MYVHELRDPVKVPTFPASVYGFNTIVLKRPAFYFIFYFFVYIDKLLLNVIRKGTRPRIVNAEKET